jgi:hypothetical protein
MRRVRRRTGVLWLWLAIDPCTKIIPVLRRMLCGTARQLSAWLQPRG